nr:putative transposase [Ipomoea trifida]
MVNFRRLRSLTSLTDKHNSHVVDKPQNNEVSNQQLSGIVETSNIAPRVEEQVSGCTGNENIKKRGRGRTFNTGLAKKKARGEEICILFPPPYDKVCGKDASFFKDEVTMCIRKFAPLQVSSWKEIPNEDINTMWLFLKDKFNLSNDVQPHAMKQVQLQYKNRHYHLRQSYLKCKDCPNDVNEDDWRWLIENKWETQKFKKDKDSNEWPNAVEVWKASRTKSNGTWSVPNGEEIMV